MSKPDWLKGNMLLPYMPCLVLWSVPCMPKLSLCVADGRDRLWSTDCLNQSPITTWHTSRRHTQSSMLNYQPTLGNFFNCACIWDDLSYYILKALAQFISFFFFYSIPFFYPEFLCIYRFDIILVKSLRCPQVKNFNTNPLYMGTKQKCNIKLILKQKFKY